MSVISDCYISPTANFSNATDHESWPTSSDIALATFYALLSLVVVVSNIGNLVALPHVTAELGANTVFLFRALTLVDLIMGLIGSGGKFVDLVVHPSADDQLAYTSIRSILSVIFMNYSLLILGCVSINRYLLIAMPFRYKVLTHRKMVIVLVAVLVFGALQALGGLLYSYVIYKKTGETHCYFQVRNCDRIYIGFIVVYIFIPIIVTTVITFTNLRLLVIVLDHKRRIRRQLEVVNSLATPQIPKQRDIKGITTLLLTVLTFYLCCAPAFCFDSYRMATSKGGCLPKVINDFFTALLFTYSCMNSFIYLFTMKSFRNAFKRTLTCGRWVTIGGYPHMEIKF